MTSHGRLWTYRRLGCRCEECKAAHADYMRDYRCRQQAGEVEAQGHRRDVENFEDEIGVRLSEATAEVEHWKRERVRLALVAVGQGWSMRLVARTLGVQPSTVREWVEHVPKYVEAE